MQTLAPNEQEAILTRDQHRIIFFALMEAGMRYRESFYREDTADYQEQLKDTYKTIQQGMKQSFSKRKKQDDKVNAMVIEFEQKQEAFGRQVYGLLESLEKSLSPAAGLKFNDYSTAYGLIADELAIAKNTTELLTVCKLYNAGVLNHFFENLNEQEQKLNDSYENKEVIADGDHLNTGN